VTRGSTMALKLVVFPEGRTEQAAQAMIFYKDPMTFEGIWTATKDDKLWLYNDATASRVDYFERLGRLMSQKIRVVGKEPRQDHTANPYQPSTASLDHADDARETV
jgi:hypothetical protein